MHNVLRFLVLVVAIPLFAGCSTTDQRLNNLEGQMQNAQVLDLRLSNAENRLTRVEEEVNGIRGALSPARGGARKKGAGKAEEKNYAPQVPAATIKTPYPAPQVASAASQPASAPQASGKAPAPALVPVGLRGASPVASGATPSKTATPLRAARPAAARAAAPVVEKTGTGEYDAALALYYKGQYGKAREQFNGFLSRHPSSRLAPNAMYWQGECLYSQSKYDSAIIIFKDLAGRYPKHPKAAAALLKAGFSYARIQDMENARFYWQILVDDFPRSEPASIARKRLAQG